MLARATSHQKTLSQMKILFYKCVFELPSKMTLERRKTFFQKSPARAPSGYKTNKATTNFKKYFGPT